MEDEVQAAVVKSPKNISLPLTKIKLIMKSSPEVVTISQESVNIIARATEMFAQHLAILALGNSNDPSTISYGDLAEVINGRQTMEFLQDIIPRKIKAKDLFPDLPARKPNVQMVEEDSNDSEDSRDSKST